MNKVVVVFLKNENLVKTMIENGIWVKENDVPVTPLSAPVTKVSVSNIPLFIGNDVIVKEPSRFRKIAGGVKTIPIGCKNALLKQNQGLQRVVENNVATEDRLQAETVNVECDMMNIQKESNTEVRQGIHVVNDDEKPSGSGVSDGSAQQNTDGPKCEAF